MEQSMREIAHFCFLQKAVSIIFQVVDVVADYYSTYVNIILSAEGAKGICIISTNSCHSIRVKNNRNRVIGNK